MVKWAHCDAGRWVDSGNPAPVEGRADGGPAGHGQDDAGQSRGHRVRHHLLQRFVVDADLQVPRRVGETGAPTPSLVCLLALYNIDERISPIVDSFSLESSLNIIKLVKRNDANGCYSCVALK